MRVDQQALSRLDEFCQLLRKWNRSFNFISRKDVDRLVPRHILDSLSIAPYLQGSTVLDIGSGSGLPGIPLAIVRRDIRFELCDRAERRIRFLQQMRMTLELDNVTCTLADLNGEAPRDMAHHDGLSLNAYSTITARAIAQPVEVWRLAEPLLAPEGRVLYFLSTQGAQVAADINEDERFRAQLIEVKVPRLTQTHEILSLERS